MPIYKCPRCNSSDTYFADRQELRSTGGPFGESYTVDVKKAFCRKCAEPMVNMGPTKAEAEATQAAIERNVKFFTSKRGILVIAVVVLGALAFLYGLWSLVNGWIQCMDGSNYVTEIVDGETIYTNTCAAY
jgi:hypothetical protein